MNCLLSSDKTVRDHRKFKYTVYQCAVRVALIYNLVYESVTPMGNIFWLSVAIITTHWKCSKRPDSNLEHVPSLIRDSLSNTQKAYVISHSHTLFVPIQTWNIFECRSGTSCTRVSDLAFTSEMTWTVDRPWNPDKSVRLTPKKYCPEIWKRPSA